MGRFLVPLRRPLFFIAVVLALARTIIRAYANNYSGVRKRTKRQGFALKRRDYSGKTLDFPDKGGITNTELRGVRSLNELTSMVDGTTDMRK